MWLKMYWIMFSGTKNKWKEIHKSRLIDWLVGFWKKLIFQNLLKYLKITLKIIIDLKIILRASWSINHWFLLNESSHFPYLISLISSCLKSWSIPLSSWSQFPVEPVCHNSQSSYNYLKVVLHVALRGRSLIKNAKIDPFWLPPPFGDAP